MLRSGRGRATPADIVGDDRTVRVFVSSTFSDLQEERDELARKAFPVIRRLCAERGLSFVDVDLRWGITDEEAAEGRVLPICLREIERSRPFFICVLGDRYGWIPSDFPSDVLEQLPWLSDYRGRSVTDIEVAHGVLRNPAAAETAFFYFRESAHAGSAHDGTHSNLERLKDEIRSSGLPLREGFRTARELAEWVTDDLRSAIERVAPLATTATAAQAESAQHDQFAKRLTGTYVDRSELASLVDDCIFSGEGDYLLITGEPGSGRSAFLAAWYRAAKRRAAQALLSPHARGELAWQSVDVVAHFVGATPFSDQSDRILRRLTLEISTRYELMPDVDSGVDNCRRQFERTLQLVPPDRRLVVLIDGADRVADAQHGAGWLPDRIPPNVSLVISADQSNSTLAQAASHTVLLGPLGPEERLELVRSFLAAYSKSLPASLARRIVDSPASGSPRFLRTLLGELRIHGRHEELAAHIESLLTTGDIEGILSAALDRIERDFHGGDGRMVASALSLILVARAGLEEAELLALLGDGGRPLPQAVFAPFRASLEEFIEVRSGRFVFASRHMENVVRERFLRETGAVTDAHRRLAQFFRDSHVVERPAESLWHLAQIDLWEEVRESMLPVERLVQLWESDSATVTWAWTQLSKLGVDPSHTYREAIEKLADYPAAFRPLMSLMREQGRFREAGCLSQQAHGVSWDDESLRADALWLGADSFLKAGELDLALAACEAAEVALSREKVAWASLIFGSGLQEGRILIMRAMVASKRSRILLVSGRTKEAYQIARRVEAMGWALGVDVLMAEGAATALEAHRGAQGGS